MTEYKPENDHKSHDELLTLQEAAEHLKVTPRTIRNLISDGELPARRIGKSRMLRVQASALDGLLTDVRTAGSWTE